MALCATVRSIPTLAAAVGWTLISATHVFAVLFFAGPIALISGVNYLRCFLKKVAPQLLG